jgi:hypothetical protein
MGLDLPRHWALVAVSGTHRPRVYGSAGDYHYSERSSPGQTRPARPKVESQRKSSAIRVYAWEAAREGNCFRA